MSRFPLTTSETTPREPIIPTRSSDSIGNQVVQLFNPQTQMWSQHLTWSEGGVYIIGLTPYGCTTVLAPQFHNVCAVTVRQAWKIVG
jgi:hypothetical protein